MECTERIFDFFKKIISPVVIQLKLENKKLIFIALDLSYANDACVFFFGMCKQYKRKHAQN